MSYERLPHQFLQGIFLAPNNFNDPENPSHGEYVNMQLKYDLYNTIMYKITAAQFGLIGNEEEEVEVL